MLVAQSSKYARGMQSQCTENFVMTSPSLQSIVAKLSFFLNCDNVLSPIVECCVASRARMWWYAICFHVCASVQHQHMATPQSGVLLTRNLQRRCFDLGKIPPCTLASVNSTDSAVLKAPANVLLWSPLSVCSLWSGEPRIITGFLFLGGRLGAQSRSRIYVSLFSKYSHVFLWAICVSVCVCVGIQAF